MTSPTPDATLPGARVLDLVMSCVECPRRVYYSGGRYECAETQTVLPPRIDLERIGFPSNCPLTVWPAASRAEPTDQPKEPGMEALGEDKWQLQKILRRYEPDVPACKQRLWGDEDRLLVRALRALSTTPNEERIRLEAAEERIREDERDRLYAVARERAYHQSDIAASMAAHRAEIWLAQEGAMSPADRAAKRTGANR